MAEDEDLTSDFEDDDGEIIGEFGIEDEDDIMLILMPKIEYDFDTEFESYYKLFKKCRRKEDFKFVLAQIIEHTSKLAILKHEASYLQERAKNLEFEIEMAKSE
ncbi:MAG: hypothetical protein QJR05_10250 [Thermoanaerobacterium sp.]|nr:hypothetical protein [Thermoanaerobacterium sp.]